MTFSYVARHQLTCGRRCVVVVVLQGSPTNGTKVQGWTKWPFSNPQCLAQLWLVTPINGTADSFTLQNLQGGLYLDLPEGKSTNGNPLQGWQRAGNNQVWTIRKVGTFYRMQNAQGGTFVDLLYGGTANGTVIEGWEGEWSSTVDEHQLWSFQLVSQTGTQIANTLNANPILKGHIVNYQLDGIYWVVDKDLVASIWTGANLGVGKKYTLRPELFDQDDFVFTSKVQLAQWGSDNIRASGLNLLFGVALGVSTAEGSGGQSCNVFLDSDLSTVLFFDAQTGKLLDPTAITSQNKRQNGRLRLK
ncbi:carbohydrate-binding module family 13 protein [Serpula lacrymans var. lacrymans S7.9]|uniref:Carbohydrate-binding module family 13 protein n=1 Tax=Serpula lacrymans var. lacrymans (strain S7.9) TaxID=578457 RepID=F8P8C2_SERL9|nr:carbohydrate-binding module family 13 protein [Serpula lacrymans var. lacrymans S7.9]EGO20678.1 carbohydrate-binding module family 13 protein [Serpula lacrymans var. lacrymans S7.9]